MADYQIVNVEIPVDLIRKIDYTDKQTGEAKSFYKVEIPDGGLAGWEFSPRYVNLSQSGDSTLRNCPLIADRPVRLSRPFYDSDHHVLRDEAGKAKRDEMEVPVETIKSYFEDLFKRGWHSVATEDIPF
jgi:hypothetical protein